MVLNLTREMAVAAEQRLAYTHLVQQTVETILAAEQNQTTAAEENETMDQAIDHLMGAIFKVHVSDIAPAIQKFVQRTTSNNLRMDILAVLEDRTDLPDATINEKVIDYLAMASIYDEDDAHKIREYNALAYYFLGQGQNDKIADIIDTLEHIQLYTADENDDQPNNPFRLNEQQKSDINQIVIAKTKDFLASGVQDPEIAKRLANLGAGIKNNTQYAALTAQFPHQQSSQSDGPGTGLNPK